jgi:hypothetical protein
MARRDKAGARLHHRWRETAEGLGGLIMDAMITPMTHRWRILHKIRCGNREV